MTKVISIDEKMSFVLVQSLKNWLKRVDSSPSLSIESKFLSVSSLSPPIALFSSVEDITKKEGGREGEEGGRGERDREIERERER